MANGFSPSGQQKRLLDAAEENKKRVEEVKRRETQTLLRDAGARLRQKKIDDTQIESQEASATLRENKRGRAGNILAGGGGGAPLAGGGGAGAGSLGLFNDDEDDEANKGFSLSRRTLLGF